MIRRGVFLLLIVFLLLQGCSLMGTTPQPGTPTPADISTPTPLFWKPLPPTFTPPPPEQPVFIEPTKALPMEEVNPAPSNPQLQPVEIEDPRYTLQPGTPAAMPGFPHQDKGCNWMGVGGQVFSLDNKPVSFVVVQLKGTMAGQTIDMLSMTGTASAWGDGGYEFTLASYPIETSGTLWLQFFDLSSGEPVSQPIYLTTYNDCARNSIMVNLVEVNKVVIHNYYFPIVGRSDLK